jgi:transposase
MPGNGSAKALECCSIPAATQGLSPRSRSPIPQAVARAVGAWLGLTPRRFQSGKVDYGGHISRRGDSQLRALLYEAAAVLLTRVRKESALRQWGLMLWKRLGFKRAATALARRMAVVLHAMWKSGTSFNPTLGAATP